MDKETGIEQQGYEIEQQKDRNGILDAAICKLTSRKLLVWSIATAFLFLRIIDADWWGYISIAYVGTQGFSDIMERFITRKKVT